MVEIKKWFIQKKFNQTEQYLISVADLVIERETEKAIYINAQSDFGNIRFWCPKSCLVSEEDRKAEAERYQNACSKYEQLKEFAEKNGVKTSARMRKSTLLQRFTTEMLDKALELNLITDFDRFQII